MTIIDEILISANQLANAGKKPTVALIKAKLTKKVPLPTIINALQSWQHDPNFIAIQAEQNDQIADVFKANDDSSKDKLIEQTIKQALANELVEMKQELAEVKQQIKSLKLVLNKIKKT